MKSSSNLDAFLIIAFLVFVMLVSPPQDSNKKESGFGLSTVSRSSILNKDSQAEGSHRISISAGNAPYKYQSYQEYIILDNWGENSVDVTGWQLKNGKDKRVYRVGTGLQRFSADVAIIPRTSSGDIILGKGERAIVTSGAIAVKTPYKIESFKENICTGYIEALPDYAFEPPLMQNCPDPEDELGVENLERECRLYVERLSPCRTPLFNQKDQYGYRCENCTERGQILSESCAAFVKEHFNYNGCLKYHGNDENFSGRTWRIFLGRGWEMWAEDYETIELFDRFGNLVASQSY